MHYVIYAFGYLVYFKCLFLSIALIFGAKGTLDYSSLNYEAFLTIWMLVAAAIFSAWFGWWAKRGITARFGLLFGEELFFRKTLFKLNDYTNGKAGLFRYQLLITGALVSIPILLMYLL